MTSTRISRVHGRRVWDSRGRPTVEAEIELAGGAIGRAIAPAGASTGSGEALDLRDGGPRCGGYDVGRAVANVGGEIALVLANMDAADQAAIDAELIALDGTPTKRRLGGNATIAVSMAVAHAAAAQRGMPLWRHLGGDRPRVALPEIQIIGGGAHAHWRTDVQDFLVVAPGAASFGEALRWTWDVYQSAGRLVAARAGGPRGIADEGGHWPEVETNEQAIELLAQAIVDSGHRPGDDVAIALDIAASDLFDESSRTYRLRLDRAGFSSAEMVERIADWCKRYPIRSVEDPLADTDWDGWQALRHRLHGRAVQVVGDDLFTTSLPRIRDGIARGAANAVLIKLNQVGTVTETIEAIRLTQSAGLQPIVSARSGETEDAFISHLAVATEAGELKVGSIQRSERNVKWNEVLRIGRTLGPAARWTPRAVFPPSPTSNDRRGDISS